MLLLADIGNTTVHLGLCDEGGIARVDGVSVDDLARGKGPEGILEGVDRGAIREVVMATVNPPARSLFSDWSRDALGVLPVEVGVDIPVPIEVKVDRPEEVGIDRLLNGFSAYHRYRRACIVVDFGTAITLDAIDKDGAYVGGAIAPGLRLSAKALWDRAALIPPVDIAQTDAAIGRTTKEAVRIGVIQGALGLVERLVRRMGPVLGDSPRVVATGGDADLIAEMSESIHDVVPDLTLEGIRLAYERSQGHD